MEDRYLGDGVYASFDGYAINLAVNDHRNKVIVLEPEVMEKLIKYYNQTKDAANERVKVG